MRLNIRYKMASFFIPKLLQEINMWAKSFASGDFSERISLTARNEMGELADSLNSMSQQIQSRIESSIAEKARLEAVFLSMFDGVMVIDNKGTITVINQTLKRLLSVEGDAVGRKPLEVIRNISIQEMARNILDLKSHFESREIAVSFPEERILLVHANPISREDRVEGAVLVFHDITELRRLETIRQDFVANVSHELRTPVSTISGYAETLLEGALEDKLHAKEFVRIIHDDAQRLTKLIKDLLDLSRIESGKWKVTLRNSAFEPLVDRVMASVKCQADKDSIQLIKEIPEDLSKVIMDEDSIAQVLFNLIENAVKYNKPSGYVKIAACSKDRCVEVSVTDNGIGIPQEDLPRIFERFYRVDKAHSRELGGTGLGLSIVKHIVHAHRGDIMVESELGRGSTFRFTLPKVF